jgi:hypothetical protein
MNARAFLSHWEALPIRAFIDVGLARFLPAESGAADAARVEVRRGLRHANSVFAQMKSPRNARMRCPISPPPSRKRREPFNCDLSVLHRCRHGNGPSAPQNVAT